MQHSLSSLFTSLPVQPALDRTAARLAKPDRAATPTPGQDQDRGQEFRLPPEPRERARGPERWRRSDEPRNASEARRPDDPRETAPRREDPPARSDPPRGAERARGGEPPRAPAERGEGEAPRRADAPGSTEEREPKETVPNGMDDAIAPVVDMTTLGADVAVGTGEQPSQGEAVDPELVVDADVQDAPLAESAALMPEAQEPTTPSRHSPEAPEAAGRDADPEAALPDVPPPQVDAGEQSAADEPVGDVAGATVETAPIERSDRQETEVAAEDAASAEPAPSATPTEQPQAASPPAQAADAAVATALAGAAPIPAQRETVPSRDLPRPAEEIQGIGVKPSSAQDLSALPLERVEIGEANPRLESGKSPHSEPVAPDAGSAIKHAMKAEQPLPSVLEPSSASSHASPAAALTVPTPPGQPAPHAPVRVVAEVPLAAVPVEIALKSLAGVNHFEIRLDPAELGRIEVRLELDEDGGVKAHLTVDRVETLALLQRDARSLERTFEQAGLKPTDGSVDLSLRDHSHGQGRQESGGDQRREATRNPDRPRKDGEVARMDPAPRRLWRGAAGIDVRI
jgi:hypothetical protein